LKGDNNPCWRGGKPKCEDCKKTLSFHYRNRCRDCFIKYNQGKNHYNWQGGITKLSAKIRNSHKYRLWRKSILERDNYTCQICNQVGGELNVDHIKGFAKYPRLRFKESNARTLCVSCHKLTDNYLYKAIYA
jgi:5-methylcytosine-specific restriction endonuclease McrA